MGVGRPWPGTRPLFDLALTCKSLLPVAQACPYKNILPSSSFQFDPTEQGPRTRLLARTLCETPSLGIMIRTLNIGLTMRFLPCFPLANNGKFVSRARSSCRCIYRIRPVTTTPILLHFISADADLASSCRHVKFNGAKHFR